jgi:hypothetical protein
LFLGINETWRWAVRADAAVHGQFWTQTMRHLARRPPGRPRLLLDKRHAPYALGESIRVTVHFPEDAPAPPDELPVRVRVVHRPDEGKGLPPTELDLVKPQGREYRFETVWTAKAPGRYFFVLQEPRQGGPAGRAAARVLPPPGERDLLRANEDELEAATELSGGRAYDLKSAAKLPDDLPRR